MGVPVTFGLLVDFRNPAQWHQPWAQRYREIMDQIAWVDAEVPEITGVFVTEHHFFEDGYVPSSTLACAAIAARTERITVGTNLLALPLHHPLRVAEDALVTDALSAGRFRLGVGAGYIEQEFEAFGTPIRQRPSRLEEGIEVIRAAFRGEPFSFEGKRYRMPEVLVTPPPIRAGGPGLWMGADSPAGVDRIARLGDGFYCTLGANVQRWFEACERNGRPPERRHLNRSCFTVFDEDPERAFAEAGPHFMHLLNEYIRRGGFGGIPLFTDPADARSVATELGALLCMDAADAVAALNARVDEGAIEFHLSFLMPGEPLERMASRVRYFAEHIAPAVKLSEHPSAGKPAGAQATTE